MINAGMIIPDFGLLNSFYNYRNLYPLSDDSSLLNVLYICIQHWINNYKKRSHDRNKTDQDVTPTLKKTKKDVNVQSFC